MIFNKVRQGKIYKKCDTKYSNYLTICNHLNKYDLI